MVNIISIAFCVKKWDTNGDGELSYEEAASITTIEKAFKENEYIASFDEFQYFTGITAIDDEAFLSCKNLYSISIPKNVKTIGNRAFYCAESEGSYIYYTSSLSTISLPDGLISIGDYAFERCNFLKSITIPASVTLIGTSALNCTVQNIYFKPSNPPTFGSKYIGTNATKIYVPQGSVEQYKAVEGLNTREIIGYDFE